MSINDRIDAACKEMAKIIKETTPQMELTRHEFYRVLLAMKEPECSCKIKTPGHTIQVKDVSAKEPVCIKCGEIVTIKEPERCPHDVNSKEECFECTPIEIGLVPLDKSKVRSIVFTKFAQKPLKEYTVLSNPNIIFGLEDLVQEICDTCGIPSQPALHACTCQYHPDSARTVRKIGEGVFKCPRCGGITVAQPAHLDDLKVAYTQGFQAALNDKQPQKKSLSIAALEKIIKMIYLTGSNEDSDYKNYSHVMLDTLSINRIAQAIFNAQEGVK